MKKLILLCILTFVISQMTFSQQYGYKDISANIPGDSMYHDLSDVSFVSDDEGWISSSSHAEIYHTTDGGETFEIQTTQFPCYAIQMISENEGYAGGDNGRIYRTTDGGNNWIAIGSTGSSVFDLDLADAQQGYACCDNGSVYGITSSGLVNLNSGLGSSFKGISAPSVNNVWICGSSRIFYYDGATFSEQFPPSGEFTAITMLTNDIGWVAGYAGSPPNSNGLIAGCNGVDVAWTVHIDIQQYEESLYNIYSLNSNELWTVGFQGAILHTSNGSDYGFDSTTSTGWSNVIWERQGEGLTSNFLRAVNFTSSTNGYVVGNNRTLLKYTQVSGIADDGLEKMAFEIYPNPAQGILNITCSGFKTENGSIKVLSVDGKELFTHQVKKGNENIELDLTELKAGMYLCKLNIGDRSSTQKIIIE